ncbi:cell division protein ZapA [Amylibacter sp. SFDW26]|uniref:cell division protein ZapA n=1 Tax=Amylibacter sp. SFDW26 TaxID=2652722 RepID=UPI0012622667|nr:cell division protein ZapA [Amylibacter sp. SFDW26]KAB7616055.1 cell division protein ZapA [Amylibacter sp. SFDW26]
MPEIKIHIGGREFEVVCKEGEEDFLHAAAAMLDVEADALNTAMGRIPESRMLLMSGLMLADKTASLEDQLAAAARENEGGPLAHEVSAEIDKLKADLATANDELKAVGEKLKVADDKVEVAEKALAEKEKSLAEKTAEAEQSAANAEDSNSKLVLAVNAIERMVESIEKKGA